MSFCLFKGQSYDRSSEIVDKQFHDEILSGLAEYRELLLKNCIVKILTS